MEPLSPSSASPIGAILSSVSEGRDDFSASAASLGQVAIDSAATGRWKKGDRDWFAVSLDADRSYQFQLSSSGKRLTPQLLLRNAAGDVVARSLDSAGSSCALSFESTSSGLFYLDAGSSGRGKGSYQLSAAVADRINPPPPAPVSPAPTPQDPITAANPAPPALTIAPAPERTDGITGLLDETIQQWVHTSLSDSLLSKAELRQILACAGDGGVVDANELTDLRRIGAVLSTYLDPSQSAYLSDIYSNVAESNPANAWWSGGGGRTALGNLQAGSSSLTLERLLGKWFDGTDLPVNEIGGDSAAGISGSRFSYGTTTGSLLVDDVNLDDVSQGAAGTCYLLAAAQVAADSMPALIHELFCDNGDGTYGVRFYGNDRSSFWVTVNSSLPLNGQGQLLLAGNASKSRSGELWVSLLEKAYAQANETGWLGRDLAINSYQEVEGGLFEALSHLSGSAVTAYSAYYAVAGSTWAGRTRSWQLAEAAAQAALSSGKSLWLGSFGSSNGSNGKTNLVAGHAFAISSYNSSTGTYRVHNPWGASGGANWNGSFEVSWRELYSARGIVAWV
ncbi:MAG: hypothetical protein RLZZ54_953 [Cyanobacteriota bacterium]|jgi:hypothetical protein